MNAPSKALRLPSGTAARWLAVAVTAIAIVVIARSVDVELAALAVDRAADRPDRIGLALGAFAAAFVLRAVAWRRVLPGLSFGHALSAIHVALGANHVLPFRLGEPLRIVSVTRRANVSLEAATASTITLRAADMLAVAAIGLVAGPAVFVKLIGPIGWLLLAVVAVVAVHGWRWLRSVAARRDDVVLPGPITFGLAAAAWLAESLLVWQAARWAGLEIGWAQAVLVTAVAVAAQIAAVAPGGFGTYEAAAVAAYVALGFDPEPALVAALGAHGLKTAYSLAAGAVASVVPGPGLAGRLRLAAVAPVAAPVGADRSRPMADPDPDVDPDPVVDPGPVAGRAIIDGPRPIVLFMPAHNEEAAVGDCVHRTPSEVSGHRVEVLVIDDGSTDDTARWARQAGAEVISMLGHCGLGAAVRTGLAEGVNRGAAVVAFCDADGEYRPEELERLVAPILDGDADYVVGSRFLGRIDHMQPHRRIGNRVLTALLSIVARRRLTDGQTGYRAFSAAAAADAEVIHDFNYAQVITLDLLAKGYRYREVPITYRFRTAGESYIRLGRYLSRVVPAVYREVNTA